MEPEDNSHDDFILTPWGILLALIELLFVAMGVHYSWGVLGPKITIALIVGGLVLIWIGGLMNAETKRPEDEM